MAQLKDICALDNGAHFHNADLHIHSFGASHDVKDSTMTPEAIVESAVKQNLHVIAITDHNSNKNVDAAVAYAQAKHPGKILVLPGVEVTTAHGHLLVYFAPDKAKDLAKFLTNLDLKGEMGDENTRTAKSMSDTIAAAYELGGICVAAHIDRDKTGFDKFAPGFQNWKKDIITSPGLYGLECDDPAALTWFSERDTGADAAERKKMFAARSAIPELKARRNLAHFQGSDSHFMKQFEHVGLTKRWSRIKMSELTFDAFRVALVDSTARVRACGSIPRLVPRIRAVAMTGGFLHEEKIHFSDNLNCFIGGRGTGKSTAIRAIAYALGENESFAEFDNCPDSIVVYAEDGDGVIFRYTRTRGGELEVKAREDGSIDDVPEDSFRVEYFGQGELAKVAEDPLKNPILFQEFLDRHTSLRDLLEKEQTLVTSLRENAGRLEPLEGAFNQLEGKKQTLKEIDAKLKVAEEGNLKGIVGTQSKLASERALRESLEAIITEYDRGYTLGNIEHSFDDIVAATGECTADAQAKTIVAAMKTTLEANNTAVKAKNKELNTLLKECARALTKHCADLKANHQRMNAEIAVKLADLKARGQATDLTGLEALLRQKTSIAAEIASIERRATELKECRQQRKKLRQDLKAVREEMTARRKLQLAGINAHLASTITDYSIFVKYDDVGITEEFETFLQEKMHGTHLQDDTIEHICRNIMPSDLADLILAQDSVEIANRAGITQEWAQKIVAKLFFWGCIFELQALAKQPKPVISVMTKSAPPKRIPVLQLSDGQRHTILLTIAMLAESNVPLIIDQPEDDLDNAFVFSSIVSTLRAVKERRQVILVTHNANIAVLGDSELILPMNRENDCGKIKDRGSIDTKTTKAFVQSILEGGAEAFLRRKEIYDH